MTTTPLVVPPPARRYRLTRLSTIQPRPVSWLLPGRIPFGALTVLAGPPGGGKSQFGIRLAADLGNAGVPTLMVGDEDGMEDTVLPRLLAAGGDSTRVALFDLHDDLMAQMPTDVPLMEDAIRETGAALVFIDPIQAHLAGEINPNVDASLRQATRPLARMAQRTGAAVIMVTHLRKSREGTLMDRVGGSGGLVGAARSVLLFGRRKSAPENESYNPWDEADLRYACHVKANGAQLAPTLRCRIEPETVMAGDVRIESSQLLLEADTGEISAHDLE
jgi:AAA domain